MKISRVILIISTVLISVHLQAQINKSASIKSLEYKFYKVKVKDNKIIKSKPTILFEGYPIFYSTSKLFFNKDGLLIKENKSHQKDTTYYNAENQKYKMVLYPDGMNDSIIFNYSYDSFGNIETIKKIASAPKMDFSLKGNYYSYKALTDEFYENYYLSKANPNAVNQFEAIKPVRNYFYRLYNEDNKLAEEKSVYDSRIRKIKYQYNKENKIVKISKIDKETNSNGKIYTSTETEHHKYFKNGLIHEVKYFINGNLYREELVVHNSKGILTEYTEHTFGVFNRVNKHVYDSKGELIQYIFTNPKKNKIIRNITLKYTYNSKGDWITCIHFDKKNRPKYLIEQIVEYH